MSDAAKCPECPAIVLPYDIEHRDAGAAGTITTRRYECPDCGASWWQDSPADGIEDQADDARYVRAWFLFVSAAGEPSNASSGLRISIGATRAGRVRVIVPNGLMLAPAVAERVGELAVEAARVARER